MSTDARQSWRSWLTVLLVASTWGAARAAETWVVPATSAPVTAEFTGFIEADRGRLINLMPPGQRLVVANHVMPGRQVSPGDPVLWFDTQLVARDLPQKIAERDEAEIRYRLDLLKLDRERADLADRLAKAQSELATVRTRLAAVGTDDAADAALARNRADLAAGEAARAVRAAERAAARASAGDLSPQELADARHAAAQAQLEAKQAEAAAERAATRDRSADRERLRLDELQAMGVLGLVRDATGEHGDPAAGLPARLAQNELKRTVQEAALAAERDARRKALQETIRDLHDHCPLAALELIPATGSPRRIDFTAGPAADGWQRDGGEVFSADRGFGWDRDLSAQCFANGAPGASIAATDSWCLVREAAVWRIQVADGQWTLRVTLGADADWDGAVVRADAGNGPQLVQVSNRIAAKERPVTEIPVTVHGGTLRLLVGGEPGKHLYAPVAGTFLLHPRTERGRKTDGRGRPLAFVAEPAAVRLNARAPADVAALLLVGKPPATGDLRLRSATGTVTILPPGQAECVATVTAVGGKPAGNRLGPAGWNEEDPGAPQDLTFREINASFAAADAARLALRSRVVARLEAQPPAGIIAVPPWYVAWRDSAAWIRVAGAWRAVEAMRAGPATLVAGLEPGLALQLPVGEPPADPATQKAAVTLVEGGYPGEVIAGSRVQVTQPGGWGRVATLIPDGSEVQVGDELLTLYNPVIEQQRDQFERDRRQAERGFAEAAAARRERMLQSGDDRRNDHITEGRARITLSEARRPDPGQTEADIAHARALAEREHAAAASAGVAALVAPPPGELADRGTAAERATVQEQRALLDAVRTTHVRDWAAAARADIAWHAALTALGQREAKDVLARAEDKGATAKAQAALARSRQGQSWVADFENNKRLVAPAAGRMYWLLAWNDQTRTRGKLTKDVWVWRGVPVAEIIDLAKLSFTAELPEILYPRMQVGTAVQVRFPVLGDRRLRATVTTIGQALALPRDAAAVGSDEKITDLRVFTVTVALELPADARGQVQPGLRGILELP